MRKKVNKTFLFLFLILGLFFTSCDNSNFKYLNGDTFSFRENISKEIISKDFVVKNLGEDTYLKSFVTTCDCVRTNFYYKNISIKNISSDVIFDNILVKKNDNFTFEIIYNLTFHSKNYLGYREQYLVIFDDKNNKIRIKILGDVYK